MTAPKKTDWTTTPNERRHRKQVHVTMSPEGIKELDRRRLEEFAGLPGTRPYARGEYIEMLLATTMTHPSGLGQVSLGKPKSKRKKAGR